MRDQSNAIREQVSFKQREDHIRQTWMFLCKHYKLNKSDLVKFLIKKEEYFLRRPEGVLSGIVHDWMWNGISLHQVQCRIAFLQEQLDSLEHYLPETYQYLMNEMDTQQRNLMELKIHSYYQQQSNEQ